MSTKVRKSFGFGPAVALTEIEEKARVVFDSNKYYEDLRGYEGTFVQIYINGVGYPGIYRGTTTNGTHVLMPSIFSNGENYFNPEKLQKEKYFWRDLPDFHSGRIEGFKPLSKIDLEACAGGFSDVESLGKIFA